MWTTGSARHRLWTTRRDLRRSRYRRAMFVSRGRAAFLFAGLLLPVLAACSTALAGAPQPVALPVRPAETPVPGSVGVPGADVRITVGVVVERHPPGVAERHRYRAGRVDIGRDRAGWRRTSRRRAAIWTRWCAMVGSCFESGTVPGPCGALAPGDEPVFMVFSPDGGRLLLVAGPDEQARAAYVLDTDDGEVRAIGPSGITDGAAAPARWHLSSVAWSSDGSAVVLVPHTDGDTGPVLSADLAAATVTEIFRLPADLANGRPSIWPTREGTAVVGNTGADVRTVWWADRAGGELRSIGRFDQDGRIADVGGGRPAGPQCVGLPTPSRRPTWRARRHRRRHRGKRAHPHRLDVLRGRGFLRGRAVRGDDRDARRRLHLGHRRPGRGPAGADRTLAGRRTALAAVPDLAGGHRRDL